MTHSLLLFWERVFIFWGWGGGRGSDIRLQNFITLVGGVYKLIAKILSLGVEG